MNITNETANRIMIDATTIFIYQIIFVEPLLCLVSGGPINPSIAARRLMAMAIFARFHSSDRTGGGLRSQYSLH